MARVIVRAASALAGHDQLLPLAIVQPVNLPEGSAEPAVQKSTSPCGASARNLKRSPATMLPLQRLAIHAPFLQSTVYTERSPARVMKSTAQPHAAAITNRPDSASHTLCISEPEADAPSVFVLDMRDVMGCWLANRPPRPTVLHFL